MKKNPYKPPAQLERERAEKEAEALCLCLARLHYMATAHYFKTKIKRALDCDFSTAERHFEAALNEGKIIEVGRSFLGDVKFFRAV